MDLESMSRQRIDYTTGPGGETIATLTVTLGDGSVHRFSASVDDAELDRLGEAFAKAETPSVQGLRIEGLTDEEIAGLFGDIAKGLGKAVKKVANVAKKVASSKVFRLAGQGLTAAAPALGPFGPAALAVGGGMQVASKLASSAVAAEAGARRAAKALGLAAGKKALAAGGGSTVARLRFLKFANLKRKGAARVAAGRRKPTKRKPAPRRTVKRAPTKRTTARPNLITAARAGRLRSNKPGAVSLATLTKANKAGRVFWVG